MTICSATPTSRASLRVVGLERAKGIEPSSPAWEAGALPLSYARSGARILAEPPARANPRRRLPPEPIYSRPVGAPAIAVRNLCVRYGSQVAVDDVSFEVQPGQILGYLGPNGAGKSTTVKVLCGMLLPTSGEVRVAGFDVATAPLEVKRRLGYVPESGPSTRASPWRSTSS